MKNHISRLVPILISVWLIRTAVADQFDVLSPRFSGTSQSLHGIAFANGTYIVVGDNGTILSSTDTVTWVPQVSGTTNRLRGVTYGTNGFVAVGDASTILQSADGLTWTQRPSPVTNGLSAIAYGVGEYVAVGTSGIVITSTNGVNWSSVTTGAPYNFNGIDGGSGFVAVGDSGLIMTSPDGLAWTLRFSGTFSRLNAVSGMTVVGDSGTIETSSDGINWTVVTSGTTANLLAAAGAIGLVGQNGVFLTSNGSSWTAQNSGTTSNLNGIVYAQGNYLAVGDSGLIQAAIPWLSRDSTTMQSLNAVTYGGGYFMAAGGTSSPSTNVIVRSPNGKDWTVVYASMGGSLHGITYGASGYVAVGDSGAILTSSDGLNWSSQILGSTNYFQAVAYENGVYAIVGVSYDSRQGFDQVDSLVFYRSTDGLNWTGPYSANPSVPRTSRAYGAITFGGDIFVAVFENLAITSPDGVSWAPHNTGADNYLSAVAYGNGIFLAVSEDYRAVSQDGANWSASNNGNTPAYCITYGDQGFVGAWGYATGPFIFTTPDGTNVESHDFGGASGAIAFGNGSYVIVGGSQLLPEQYWQDAGGAISQSIPTNAQPMPLITGKFMDHGFRISAIAQPNHNYQIQSCTNLAGTNWSNVFTYTSMQAVTTFTNSDATNRPLGFYRILSY